MYERAPQSEVDQVFKDIIAHENQSESCHTNTIEVSGATQPDDVELSEFYRHLIDRGYSDQEISVIFDLEIKEGKIYEV